MKTNLLLLLVLPVIVLCMAADRPAPLPIVRSIAPDSLQAKAESLYLNMEFDSAIACYRQLNNVYIKNGDHKNQAQTILKIADCFYNNEMYDSAAASIGQSEKIINAYLKNDLLIEAELYCTKGMLEQYRRQYLQSSEMLMVGIKLRASVNGYNDTALAKFYNNLGQNFCYENNYAAAFENCTKASDLTKACKNQRTLEHSEIFSNLGFVNRLTGNFDASLSWYNISMSLLLEIKVPNRFIQPYIRLALLYMDFAYYTEAIKFLEKAENICIENKMVFDNTIGYIFTTKSKIYYTIKDYERALTYNTKAREIHEKNAKQYGEELFSDYCLIGHIFYVKNDYAKALEYYFKSFDFIKKDDYNYRGFYNNYLALCYQKLKEYKRAEKHFDFCVQNHIKALGKDHYQLGIDYLYYGNFYLDCNKTQKSLDVFNKALNIFLNKLGEKHFYTSSCYTYIGDCNLRLGNYEKALRYYQNALVSGIKDYNDTCIYSYPPVEQGFSDHHLLSALKAKSNAFYRLYAEKSHDVKDLAAALKTAAKTVEHIERMRSGFLSDESKLFISAEEKPVYHTAMKLAAELYRAGGGDSCLPLAFRYSEKCRAASLLAQLKSSTEGYFSGVPQRQLTKKQEFAGRIAFYKNAINDELKKDSADRKKIALWDDKAFEFMKKHDSIESLLTDSFPVYRNRKFDNRILSLDEVQKKLSGNEALLEYTITDSALYIFAITRSRCEMYVQPTDSMFIRDIDTLLRVSSQCNYSGYNRKTFDDYVSAACRMYAMLIKPCIKLVEGKKLIIIPDEKLGLLSFDLLLSHKPPAGSMDYRTLPYLIKKYAISYSYSANLKYVREYVPGNAPKTMLAVAPYTAGEESDHTNGSGADKNSLSTHVIRYTLDEIKYITELFDGDALTGREATEQAFRSVAGNYRILHLAMHTAIDSAQPLFSKLLFYGALRDSSANALSAYEIFALGLRPDLVTLSACYSGGGKLERGEGVMSLSRGFIYSGCPSLALALWAVQDKSALDVMSGFYSNLYNGMEKDEALRKAKIDYISKSDPLAAHPHFWASFIIVGNTAPVEHGNKRLWYLLAGAGVLVGILLVIAIWKIGRRRRKNC